MADYTETRIQFRRGTANDWSTSNPVLGKGEPGYDTTNDILKVGNGVDAWSSLTGMSAGSVSVSYTTAEITGLTGNIDDWTPSSSVDVLQVSPSSPILTIRGINASYTPSKFSIINTSDSNKISLPYQNPNSASANQLYMTNGVGIVVYPDEQVDLIYDGNLSKWIVTKRGIPSNTRPILNSYSGTGTVSVESVNNLVIVSQDTYDNIVKDPNTIYFVP